MRKASIMQPASKKQEIGVDAKGVYRYNATGVKKNRKLASMRKASIATGVENGTTMMQIESINTYSTVASRMNVFQSFEISISSKSLLFFD